jgi:hypothetical protein
MDALDLLQARTALDPCALMLGLALVCAGAWLVLFVPSSYAPPPRCLEDAKGAPLPLLARRAGALVGSLPSPLASLASTLASLRKPACIVITGKAHTTVSGVGGRWRGLARPRKIRPARLRARLHPSSPTPKGAP